MQSVGWSLDTAPSSRFHIGDDLRLVAEDPKIGIPTGTAGAPATIDRSNLPLRPDPNELEPATRRR